jgi:streptomycin 6-kinase
MGSLETFRTEVEARVGDDAKLWVAGVRALIAELVDRWELELGDPVDAAAGRYVVPGVRSGQHAVFLALTYPDGWFFDEVAALIHWDGDGAVPLLDHDPRGAELLARPEPGTPLATLDDEDEALGRAAAVAERLWIADPGGLASVAGEAQEWARTMLGRHHLAGRPFERDLVHEAVAAIRDLLGTAPTGVLLHGDLTLAHVVEDGERDVAIEPRPLVGEPEFDAAALLRDKAAELAANPEEGRDRIQHRFDLLRERLGLDGVRLKSWALAVAVDEAIWDHEQGATAVGRRQAAVAKLVRDLSV